MQPNIPLNTEDLGKYLDDAIESWTHMRDYYIKAKDRWKQHEANCFVNALKEVRERFIGS